MKNQRK